MWLKRIFKGTCGLAIIGGIGFACWMGYNYVRENDLSRAETSERIVWQGTRPVPATVEPGAYLAALHATFKDDLEKSAAYYLKVFQGDPDNEVAGREAYFFNAILGRFDLIQNIVEKLSPLSRFALFADYAHIGYALKANNWAVARQEIEARQEMPLAEITLPLLKAWTYVGENNFEGAMKALDPLSENSELSPYYHYHQGLIALALHQDFVADEAFQKLAQKDLPVFSMYPEIIAFYVSRGEWRAENPVYMQWKVFMTQQPATAELILQATAKPLNATRGVAEVLYNLSTAVGSTKDSYEGALILSALSLYLNPKQELPKIWSAEVLEQAQKPHLASYYYAQVPPTTETMEFKKAMNLIACGRESEAKSSLLHLKNTNKNSAQLWWALATVYQHEKNWSAAARAYTHILEIEGESNRKQASNTYFARSFVYGAQKNKYLEEKDLKRALELNPENPMLLNHLGYQWLENDQMVDKGFDLVQQAYKMRASDPHIIDSMAFGYYRKADYQKALPLAEKTVDIMPQSSVANAHLGDIYRALGRNREAVFQYKKALVLKYDLTPELKQELLYKIAQQEGYSVK